MADAHDVREDAESHYERAQHQNAADQFHDAAASYSAALTIDPLHLKARLGRGMALQRLGQHGEAIDDFTRALDLAPDWAGAVFALYGRASSHYALKEFDAAIADCTDAIRRNPSHIDSLYLRAIARKQLEHFDRAIEDLAAVVRVDPAYHEARCALGKIHVMQGDNEAAVEHFSAYIESAPMSQEYLLARRMRGIAFYHLERYAAALEDLSIAIDGGLNDASTYARRALVLRALGMTEAADDDMKTAKKLFAKRGRQE